MGDIKRILLLPGGMNTDTHPEELSNSEHKEVKNLKLSQDGYWESVPGYFDIRGSETNIKSVIEIEHDHFPDRFILMQLGTTLYRVDFGSDYAFPPKVALTLPAGVTIPSTSTLTYDYHQNELRIMGASDVLVYFVKDGSKFIPASPSQSFFGWYMEKSSIETSVGITINDMSQMWTSGAGGAANYVFRHGIVYNDAQYSLLQKTEVETFTNVSGLDLPNKSKLEDFNGVYVNEKSNMWCKVKVPKSIDRRASSILITSYKVDPDIVYDDSPSLVDYKINALIPLDEALPEVSFPAPYMQYYAVTPKRLQFHLNPTQSSLVGHGFFEVGSSVSITDRFNNTLNTSVTGLSIDDSSDLMYVDFFHNIHPTLGTGVDVDQDMGGNSSSVTITPRWSDDVDYYYTVVGFNIDGTNSYMNVGDGVGVSNINQGVEDIHTEYSFRATIEGVSYIKPDDKDNIIRFSPTNQPDVFPEDNVISLPAIGNDRILALTKKSERMVFLRQQSVGQGGFSNGQYFEDISSSNIGLYASKGFLNFGDSVIFMGRTNLYSFSGVEPAPMLTEEKVAKYYEDNVSESSFLIYDQSSGHLILQLTSTKTLVKDVRGNAWYIRDMDLGIIGATPGVEGDVFMFSSTKIILPYHANSPSSEANDWSFDTKTIISSHPDRFSKLRSIYMTYSSSHQISVSLSDAETSGTKSITVPLSTDYTTSRFDANFLFKKLEISASPTSTSTTMDTKIKSIYIDVENWN